MDDNESDTRVWTRAPVSGLVMAATRALLAIVFASNVSERRDRRFTNRRKYLGQR